MGIAFWGTFLRQIQQEWWQLAGCHKDPHINGRLRSSVMKCIQLEEPGYRQMVLIYMHRSFWEKVRSEANWFENRSTSPTFLELGGNLEGAWWTAAWGLKEQGLPAPRVYTRYALCHMSIECLSLIVCLSFLPLETIFLDLPHLFLVSHFLFILTIILLKNFKLKYSFVFF